MKLFTLIFLIISLSLSANSEKLTELERTISNFQSTLENNPALRSIIQPKIEAAKKERDALLQFNAIANQLGHEEIKIGFGIKLGDTFERKNIIKSMGGDSDFIWQFEPKINSLDLDYHLLKVNLVTNEIFLVEGYTISDFKINEAEANSLEKKFKTILVALMQKHGRPIVVNKSGDNEGFAKNYLLYFRSNGNNRQISLHYECWGISSVKLSVTYTDFKLMKAAMNANANLLNFNQVAPY